MTILLCLVFVWTLLSSNRDAAGTVCSDAVTDGTDVLNMCEDGTAVGGRVVIDTYGSSSYRQDGGSINCSCTATLTEPSSGTIPTAEFSSVQSLYPQPGCGSDISLIPQLQTFPWTNTNYFSCTVTNITFNIVKASDTFTVVWQSGFNGSTSGYCLSLSAGSESVLSTKCNPSFVTTQRPSVVTSTPSPTSPSKTAMTSVVTTTSTTTITNPTTTITSTVGGVITSSTNPTTITEDTTLADQMTEGDLDMKFIIAMAAGGVVFIFVCVIIAIMCSRTKRKPKAPRETESVPHNAVYDSTYRPGAEVHHVVTSSGDVYAQVERDSRVETTNSKDQFREREQETEHVMTYSGDIYAVPKRSNDSAYL